MSELRLLHSIEAATDAMRRATAIDLRLGLTMDRMQRLLRGRPLQRRYNPDWRLQPRVPRGNRDGGQWTRGTGGWGDEDDRPVPSDAVARVGDIHHLVEKASALGDFPESWIEGDDNRLGVPTLKHWRVTGWFMTPNEDYGGTSPRIYLRGKSWDERVEIGKRALRAVGVLNP